MPSNTYRNLELIPFVTNNGKNSIGTDMIADLWVKNAAITNTHEITQYIIFLFMTYWFDKKYTASITHNLHITQMLYNITNFSHQLISLGVDTSDPDIMTLSNIEPEQCIVTLFFAAN